MPRGNDTKTRAQRIELDYFTRRHWLRSARGWLAAAAVVVTGAWLATHALRHDPTPASPGPVAAAHHMIADRCERCHSDPASPKRTRWLGASDDACRACHRMPVPDHQPIQRKTPSCASCHVEHRGAPALVAVATDQCTSCHADLRAASTQDPTLVSSDAFHITGFGKGHMEFAVGGTTAGERTRLGSTPPPADRSHIKFSHKKHLAPDLLGPDRTHFVKLECTDCHRGPFEPTALPYGKRPRPGAAEAAMTAIAQPQFDPAEEPQYFAPIRYASDCAACHPHTFDTRIDSAPHDTPYVVRRFLEGAYARYARDNPEVIHGTPRPRQIAPSCDGMTGTATSAGSAEEWAKIEVTRAEELLYRRPCDTDECCMRCLQCHYVEDAQGAEEPKVVPPALPTRWLPQSRFDHAAHREITCRECHAADRSTTANDVLMPRLETCQRCHRADRASERCAECHTYHGALAPKDLDGPHTIQEITGQQGAASASSGGGGT